MVITENKLMSAQGTGNDLCVHVLETRMDGGVEPKRMDHHKSQSYGAKPSGMLLGMDTELNAQWPGCRIVVESDKKVAQAQPALAAGMGAGSHSGPLDVTGGISSKDSLIAARSAGASAKAISASCAQRECERAAHTHHSAPRPILGDSMITLSSQREGLGLVDAAEATWKAKQHLIHARPTCGTAEATWKAKQHLIHARHTCGKLCSARRRNVCADCGAGIQAKCSERARTKLEWWKYHIRPPRHGSRREGREEGAVQEKAIANHSKQWIANFGCPRVVVTDQGSNFMSAVFKALCLRLGIHRINTTAYHPSTNGTVERTHSTLKRFLAVVVKYDQSNWDSHLPTINMSMRSSVHRSTKTTPFHVVHGAAMRLPYDIVCSGPQDTHPTVMTATAAANAMAARLKDIRDAVMLSQTKAAQRYKADFDKKARDVRYEIGDIVMLYDKAFDLQPGTRTAAKLAKQWRGPYRVTAKGTPHVYTIAEVNGTKHATVNAHRLRRCMMPRPFPDLIEEPIVPEEAHTAHGAGAGAGAMSDSEGVDPSQPSGVDDAGNQRAVHNSERESSKRLPSTSTTHTKRRAENSAVLNPAESDGAPSLSSKKRRVDAASTATSKAQKHLINACSKCGKRCSSRRSIVCAECGNRYHTNCLGREQPTSDWYCSTCVSQHQVVVSARKLAGSPKMEYLVQLPSEGNRREWRQQEDIQQEAIDIYNEDKNIRTRSKSRRQVKTKE